jgi:hypothetical protein
MQPSSSLYTTHDHELTQLTHYTELEAGLVSQPTWILGRRRASLILPGMEPIFSDSQTKIVTILTNVSCSCNLIYLQRNLKQLLHIPLTFETNS